MSLATGARLGPYEILSAIGAGGMGEVYRARDTKLNRDVAIKVLPESFRRRCRAAGAVQPRGTDPRLAQSSEHRARSTASKRAHGGVTRAGDGTGRGRGLSQRIARGAIPLDEALPIAKQIAEALEAAHEQGIIHRDLKPANIKVRADGTVKVLDFGLAKPSMAAGRAASAARRLSQSPTITTPAMTTGVGMILGTAAYMSPEQARGKTVDKRADIWAFGAVLFEMLTGTRAFAGEDISTRLRMC